MLTLSEISKAYGGRILFDDVTLQLNREDRIGLVGPNGAGKSTLFSIILGEEEADSGQVMKERNVVFGYLPQESAPVGDETVLELATAISPEFAKLRRLILSWDSDHHIAPDHVEEIHDDAHNRFHELGGYQLDAKAKQILSGLGFREKDFDRKSRELSGGWVMRAHLARLLVQQPDLLLLDEPTNHLDLRAKDVLLEALVKYTGTVVFVSHDRYFIDKLATRVFEVGGGKVEVFPGNYEDYLWRKQGGQHVAPTLDDVPGVKPDVKKNQGAPLLPAVGRSGDFPANGSSAPSNGNSEGDEPKKRLNPIKRKQIEDRVHELEEEISRTEDEIARLETALQNFISADESQRQSQELDQHKASHAALLKEWEAVTEAL
jgi:ABC-type multidrug transport system ATPase subunit